MNNSWTNDEKKVIVETAQKMLDKKIDLIKGSQILSRYCKDVYSDANKVFLPFIGISDDADQWPLGEAQKNCSKEYLEKINSEVNMYLKSIEAETCSACKEIIAQFS